MQKLVFISSLPISKLFGEKLDAWWFANNGFDVEFWDLARLFYPAEGLRSYFGGANDYRYIGPGHRVFEHPEPFLQALGALGRDAAVWHLSRFYKSVPDDWVFAELQQRAIPFYLQHFDTMVEPLQFTQKVRAGLTARKQRLLNRKLLPKGIVGSGRLGRKQARLVFPNAHFVSIPSIKVRWQPSAPLVEGSYNLFVDESVDYAPDAKMLGRIICNDPDAYYARLNRLFDDIEQWSGVPFVIAASGKYHYKRDRFNGRRLVYGETLPLIQHAQMVVGHMSLALDQCLVSKKPVLIVDDPNFTEAKRRGFPASLVHGVAKPVLVTEVARSVYLKSLSLRTELIDQLVCDYLREDEVSSDYYSILRRELSEPRFSGTGVITAYKSRTAAVAK